MENKLCVGDIVRLKDGDIFGIVDCINYKGADGKVIYNDGLLFGQGMELSKIESFSIIPNTPNTKWAWYKVKEISDIVESAKKWANDVPDGNENDKETFIADRVELECDKTYKAVKVVYDTPFCGTMDTTYYIFPDGISENFNIKDLFSEEEALSHAESYQYSFEDYLEQYADGYEPGKGLDYDSDCYWDDYVTSVMEYCFCEEIEVCEADGDLDDGIYFYVLTPDGKDYKVD